MKTNLENWLKQAIRNTGYELYYQEKLPSSSEDMYEIKFWVEDRDQKQYDFKTIYIRDESNPKAKAFKLLLSEYINAYMTLINVHE
jgi:hypothetical protein